MDTNQDGVSIADVAELLGDETEQENQGLETEVEQEVQEDQTEAQTEDDVQDDAEEVEFEGKAYKVPKEIKDALLRQADYTQKTQDLAEQRRTVQAREQSLEQTRVAMLQQFDKAVELREITNRLSQFEKIDWQSLAASDPTQATQLNIAYQQLQREAQKKHGELQQVQVQVQQLSDEARQHKLTEGAKYLKERIPDFNEKLATQIAEAAQKHYGITPAELKAISEDNPEPRFVHILHDAMKWRALQAEKPNAMKKVAQAAPVVKPQAAQPKRTNKAAEDRLKKNGRIEDLAAFL